MLISCWFVFCHLPLNLCAATAVVTVTMKVKMVGPHGRLRILYNEFSWKSSWKLEISEGCVMDLVVKCQLLVTQILVQLQGSLCRDFVASNGTEAGFAWCGGSQACHEAGVHMVLLLSSGRLEVGENKLFNAHFFPTYDLP